MFVSSVLSRISVLVLGAALAVSAGAASRIKLGTLVPVGTSYHTSLKKMGEAWKKESGGKVNLTIFAGGKLGGEAEMVGLMQVNSLQAALLTGVGLSEIEPGVAGLQNIPMGFHSMAEVDYVGTRLRPMLEARMEQKGFVVLFWVDPGWVRFFTKAPVATPEDLRKMKLFSWSGNPGQVELYKSAGFDAVPLETADIVPSLQTGLIDAVPLPPFYAMAAQVDTRAPHMLDLNWAPLVGALVVRKETWEALPAQDRAEMLASAAAAGVEITATGRREMDESVAAMEQRGLQVTRPSREQVLEWRAVAEPVYPEIRGKLVPADIFDETMRLLAEYRAQHPEP